MCLGIVVLCIVFGVVHLDDVVLVLCTCWCCCLLVALVVCWLVLSFLCVCFCVGGVLVQDIKTLCVFLLCDR